MEKQRGMAFGFWKMATAVKKPNGWMDGETDRQTDIEIVMGYYQNGFRDGRSVIDNIIELKIINEKLWEYNQSVQYLFIN